MVVMTDTKNTHVVLNTADIEIAKLKGIEISRFCREALHAMVVNDMNEGTDKIQQRLLELDASIHKMMIERNALNEKMKSIERQVEIARQTQDKEKQEKEMAGKLCVICKGILRFQSNGIIASGSRIEKGEFAGRHVCGPCFGDAWITHRKEWWN